MKHLQPIEFFGITDQRKTISPSYQLRRILNAFKTLLFLFVLFTVVACDQKNKEPSKKQAATPETIKILQSGQVKAVKVNPVSNVMQHTDQIGTPDHPTFDGGIINAADGIPINYDIQEQKSPAILAYEKTPQQNPITKNNVKSQYGENTYIEKFQDDWATSGKVKNLLKEAAEDGKLDYVLHRIDEKGLPASVATVPMIESNYKDSAVSPKGAAGTWQLMPKTAKDYGITDEERKQLAPATEAALTMLDELHKQFGNWELAFAAYNAGAQRVQTALQKNPNAKSVQELDLPQETKDYVNHIMALNLKMSSI